MDQSSPDKDADEKKPAPMSALLIASNFTPPFIRRFIRSREIGLTIFAGVIGVIAATFVALMSAIAIFLHENLFGLRPGVLLSEVARIDQPFVPVIGGIILCFLSWLAIKLGRAKVVDPIEANALHGGRMSFRDSAYLALQTLVSNGFGSSVGLEAGYTQLGSGAASSMGRWMRLRREDMRVIVGCGAAGAIAAAFNGPFTGAFYAFELVLAQYAIGYVAPVMAASISATIAMRAFGGAPFAVTIAASRDVLGWDIPFFLLLGLVGAGIGIMWMRALPLAERAFMATKAPRITHPIIGGLLVGGMAMISPQVLSGGHGALEIGLFAGLGISAVFTIAVLKIIAATISLGSGFRGGLFFSSLLVGALVGRAFGLGIQAVWPEVNPDITAFTLVGMGAVAAAVIGTPMTMSFLVLETTSDYGLTGAVLAAAITSNLVARETFGYSFSTWRFHLRGETVRSARDVAWVRALSVARLMRVDPAIANKDLDIATFRTLFPLGSHQRVSLIDGERVFFGIVTVADAYTEGSDQKAPITSIADLTAGALIPEMSIKDAMKAFDRTELDTLAVLDSLESRRLMGTLKESYATRRYAEEMEKAQEMAL